MFTIGIDVGQTAKDYTAVSVLEKETVPQGFTGILFNFDAPLRRPKVKPLYSVRYCERFPLGTPYPAIVEYVEKLLHQEPLVSGNVQIVVDVTSCGKPVVEMLRAALSRFRVISVSIHNGDTTTEDGWDYRTPKRDLVSTLQVLLQDGRFKIASALPSADLLMRELLNFKVKLEPATASDSFSAWRENPHDDLVFSVGLAAWYAEQHQDVDVW